jgi:hypothetical protein
LNITPNFPTVTPIVWTFFFAVLFLVGFMAKKRPSDPSKSGKLATSDGFAMPSQGPGSGGRFFGGLFAGHRTLLPQRVMLLGGSLSSGPLNLLM